MNTSVVTEGRPHIEVATVWAVKTVNDAVEFFDPVSNQPQRELLRNAKMAYASYRHETTGAGES